MIRAIISEGKREKNRQLYDVEVPSQNLTIKGVPYPEAATLARLREMGLKGGVETAWRGSNIVSFRLVL